MPRFYNSLSDIQVAAGRPLARQRAAQAAIAARAAHRDDPVTISRDAARRAVRVESDLASAVERAADKLRDLNAALSAAETRLGRMDDNAYHVGSVHEGAAAVRNQISGLPALITRAEGELTAAHHALAAHRTAMHAAFAAAEPAEDAAEPQAEPAPAAPQRGRGRPPKASA